MVVVVVTAAALVGGVGCMRSGRSGGWQASESVGRSTIPPGTTLTMAKLSSGAASPDNCAEVTFATAKPLDYDQLKRRGFVVLKFPCMKSFSRFAPVASCTRSDRDEHGQPSARAVAYYYDVATLEKDDTHQGQCLGTGGAWKVELEYDRQRVRIATATATAQPHHEIDSLMELMP